MNINFALALACIATPIPARAQQAPVALMVAMARASAVSSSPPSAMSMGAKQRLIVLSDIEGLVATTSTHMKMAIHPDSIQRIVAVTDKGSPPLTRYARVVVTIEP